MIIYVYICFLSFPSETLLLRVTKFYNNKNQELMIMTIVIKDSIYTYSTYQWNNVALLPNI